MRSGNEGARGLMTPVLLTIGLLWFADSLAMFEPLFQWAFPSQERAMYRQESFINLLSAHAGLVLLSSCSALVVALAAGIWVTRPSGHAYRGVVESLIAMGQTFPPVAVLALTVPLIGFGEGPAYIALALYGLLPMLQGVIAGLESVPRSVIDAAQGLGLSAWQIFVRVECPLAAQIALSGVRTSVTINIGTAAIAATVGSQNLGSPIIIGLSGFNTPYVLQGALLTGWLAIAADAWFAYLSSSMSNRVKAAAATA